MEIKREGKIYKIPDNDIKNYMQKLDITQAEAIELYLSDNDYIDNEEVEKLTKQAKKNKSIQHYAKSETPRKPRTPREVVNPDKSDIILLLFSILSQNSDFVGVNISNPCKLLEFTYKNKQFKLDLIEKRVKKNEK